MIQLDPSGQLDPSFSTSGTRSFNVTNRPDTATSVVIQDDDDIVVAGVSAAGGPFLPRAWVVRYQPNGDLDHTFSDGRVLTDPAAARIANDVAIQPDGDVVIVGRAGTGSATFATLRLLGA